MTKGIVTSWHKIENNVNTLIYKFIRSDTRSSAARKNAIKCRNKRLGIESKTLLNKPRI